MMQGQSLQPGMWQILPTPFRGRELAVDHGSLTRVVEHALSSGVTGLVALGVLGEAVRLTDGERAQALQTVLAAAGPLPVVCGVSALATAPAIEQAKRAVELGASAVMVLVNTANRKLLANHLTAISDSAGVGVVVQDHPATTTVVISADALTGAIADCGVAVAVKAESPPTPATVAAVTAALPGLPVFGGLGGVSLMDELASGAAGAMTGFAFPEVLVRAVEAFHRHGFAAAKAELEPYLPVMVFEAQGAVSLAIRKEILRRRGLIAEAQVRSPGVPLPSWAGAVIDAHLEALDAVSVAGAVEAMR